MNKKIKTLLSKINKNQAILIILLFIACAIVGFSYQRIEEYKSDLQDTTALFNDLQNSYDTLQTEFDVYKSDSESNIESLNATIEEQQTISDEYDKLSEEHAKCQETINGLNSKITELQGQVQNLNSQIETLKAENTSENTQTDSSSSYSPGYEETDSNNENSGTMVWVPESRGKYHSIPNCGRTNPNKATQMTKASAEALGIGPCSKCW